MILETINLACVMWVQEHVMYLQPPRLQPTPQAPLQRMLRTCSLSCRLTR